MAESELTTVARPYARAAFAYALDSKNSQSSLAAWSKMLGLLALLVARPEVQALLDNPLLASASKAGALADLMGEELSAEGGNFLALLGEHGRLALLPSVAQMFDQLKAQHEKTLDIKVVSAYEMSKAERQQLAHALQHKLQRDIQLEATVDEALIGGAVIRAQDMVIDGSVRGRLNKLAQALS